MKKILALFMTVCLFSTLYGQDKNVVLDANILGKYTGKTKRGLAHGKGKSVGTDTYEGYFYKGMKNKKGKYTYANGDVYEGEFENDQMHGEGVLYSNGNIVKGFWKEGTYKGETIDDFNGYKVITKSNLTYKPQFKKLSSSDSKVVIDIRQKRNDVSGLSVNNYSSGKLLYTSKNKLEFQGVTYPLRVDMQYKVPNKSGNFYVDVLVSFEITEAGFWKITFNN
jgi:hypothetical protein